MIDINLWMKSYTEKVQQLFKNRVWFIGLQGSYGRDEATEISDIDVVLILDRVFSDDLKKYSDLLDQLPERQKICGFVSGKEELFHWDPSDLFQFYFDTTPVVGTLEELAEKITAADVKRAIQVGVCNIYHACIHNMLHEKDIEILKALYKSANFTIQAIGYLQTGIYDKKRENLLSHLKPEEQKILLLSQKMRREPDKLAKEFHGLSKQLMTWASHRMICCENGNLPCQQNG